VNNVEISEKTRAAERSIKQDIYLEVGSKPEIKCRTYKILMCIARCLFKRNLAGDVQINYGDKMC